MGYFVEISNKNPKIYKYADSNILNARQNAFSGLLSEENLMGDKWNQKGIRKPYEGLSCGLIMWKQMMVLVVPLKPKSNGFIYWIASLVQCMDCCNGWEKRCFYWCGLGCLLIRWNC
jgi:hypothetical protein